MNITRDNHYQKFKNYRFEFEISICETKLPRWAFLSIYKNLFNKITRIFVTNDCKQSC